MDNPSQQIALEYVKVGDLRLAGYNPRRMTKKQAKDLTESIRRFGVIDPILVNKHEGREGIIIGGHQRFKIAQRLGLETVPVVKLDLPEDKERELNLRLNKNTGGWDFDMLANEFEITLLDDVGFNSNDLQLNTDKYDLGDDAENEDGEGSTGASSGMSSGGKPLTCPKCGTEIKV